jgi:hypothetical protein
MRRYEVMVILDPDLEERTVGPSLDAFLNVVKQDGGLTTINNKCEGFTGWLELLETEPLQEGLFRRNELKSTRI